MNRKEQFIQLIHRETKETKMKMISKAIVFSSIVGVCIYGFQQLRQPANNVAVNTLKTLANGEVRQPSKKMGGDKIVFPKKEKSTFTKAERTDFETDIWSEQSAQTVTEDLVKGDSEVALENGWLTVNTTNGLLSEVLVQVSNKTGVPIDSTSIDLGQRITVSMQKTSIDIVLGELLKGYDHFFLYGGAKGQLQAAWVYPKGTGKAIVLTDYDNSSKQLAEDDLYSSDPVSRVLALQQYAILDTKGAAQHIKDAVLDEDPNIRVTAILLAQENTIELSVATLTNLAKSDPEPSVRSAALNALSMNTELSAAAIYEVAESALDDSDETIQEEAEAILDGLEALENSEATQPMLQQAEEQG